MPYIYVHKGNGENYLPRSFIIYLRLVSLELSSQAGRKWEKIYEYISIRKPYQCEENNRVLKEMAMCMWNRLKWLRTGLSGGFLLRQWWIFGLHNNEKFLYQLHSSVSLREGPVHETSFTEIIMKENALTRSRSGRAEDDKTREWSKTEAKVGQLWKHFIEPFLIVTQIIDQQPATGP
jgi:hypothetical protein